MLILSVLVVIFASIGTSLAHAHTTGSWERSGETARMRSPEGETHGSARVNCSANDRLAGDSYDANGNTTAATIDGVNVSDTYDYRNRLIERTTTDWKTIRITYDGDGHRVREAVTENGITTTTEFLVDSLNPTGYAQVVEEIVQGTVTTVYTYGHELISQDVRQPGGAFAASFYLYDGHGSVRQLTDSLGTVTDAYTYDAFGILIDSRGATTNHYLFAGEQFVPSLGLYHNRARYLNAANSRFWSMDSYEGRGMEPATLHKYLYAHGDPVNGVDPSGMNSIATAAARYQIIKTINSVSITVLSIYAIYEGLIQIGDLNALLFGYHKPINNAFAKAQEKAVAKGRIKLNNGEIIIGESFFYRVIAAKIKYPAAGTFNVPNNNYDFDALMALNIG